MKLHGLEKAVGDFQRNYERLHCVMMVDLEDGYVWCDCFPDSNSWNEYHSDTIHSLNTYYNSNSWEETKITMETTKSAIRNLELTLKDRRGEQWL